MKMKLAQIVIPLMLIGLLGCGLFKSTALEDMDIDDIVEGIADYNMYIHSTVGANLTKFKQWDSFEEQRKITAIDEPLDDKYMQSVVETNMAISKQWGRFEELRKRASDEELVVLTGHPNATVRCYSFIILTQRNHPKVLEILLQHLKDNENVGMIIKDKTPQYESISDFFIMQVTLWFNSMEGYVLRGEDRSMIDSSLLFDSEIELTFLKLNLIETMEIKESYYPRLKEIYSSEKYPSILIALSKFNNPNDIELIIEWLNKKGVKAQSYGLRAVTNYPDTAFFVYLKQIYQQELKIPHEYNNYLLEMLYKSIVQYKTPESRELLEKAIEMEKDSNIKVHSISIWLALEKYPDPIYDGIKETIHLNGR